MGRVRRSFFTTLNHEYPDLETEPVDCNWCGSAQRRRLGEEEGFEICRCVQCGLVYVRPQPTASSLDAFYEAMYEEDSPDVVRARSLGHFERHIRGIVRARKPGGGALLDVGCGLGGFLDAMSGGPWRLHGLERSARAAAYARQRVSGATIWDGVIESAPIEPESMDCVTMIAVLEHAKDPRAVIQQVSRWLRPDGLLIVQVPYVQTFFTLSQAFLWLPRVHFEAPRHLFDFSPVTLPRYLREQGFTTLRTEIARPYSSPTRLGAAAIWGVKIPGILLWRLTGGRWVYPFAGAIVVHGVRGG